MLLISRLRYLKTKFCCLFDAFYILFYTLFNNIFVYLQPI